MHLPQLYLKIRYICIHILYSYIVKDHSQCQRKLYWYVCTAPMLAVTSLSMAVLGRGASVVRRDMTLTGMHFVFRTTTRTHLLTPASSLTHFHCFLCPTTFPDWHEHFLSSPSSLYCSLFQFKWGLISLVSFSNTHTFLCGTSPLNPSWSLKC